MNEKPGPLNLLWLQSGGCGGCSLSLLGAEAPDLLTTFEGAGIRLLWHPALSEQCGEELQGLLLNPDEVTVAAKRLRLQVRFKRAKTDERRFRAK